MSFTRLTGGCQCGAVRYALAEMPPEPSICHCRMCQKAFGSYFAPLASVSDQSFRVTRGEIAIFRSSDAVERGFCRACGTPLTFRYLGRPKIAVALGSLDNPEAVKPVTQYGMESRLSWLDDLSDLPSERTEDDERKDLIAKIARTNHQHPDHDTAEWPMPGAATQ